MPNPAGYYGLNMPEAIQALSTLDKFALIRWTVGAIEAKLMEAK